MNYEEYRTELLDALEKKKRPGTTVRCHTVEKNNGVTMEGLTITFDEEEVSPVYYPGSLYRSDLTEKDVEEMAVEMLDERNHHRFRNITSTRLSFEEAVHSIYYRVVNYRANQKFFLSHPCRRFLDLACTFWFTPGFLKDEGCTIAVTGEQMTAWGMDAEHLFRIAAVNTPRDYPAVFMPLIEAITKNGLHAVHEQTAGEKEIFRPEYREDPSVILTNRSGQFGASCMLYRHVFEQAAEEAGCDLFVIPSSVHELIVLPADGSIGMEDLNATVRHVNRTALQREDMLSDHVYLYDRDEKMLTM